MFKDISLFVSLLAISASTTLRSQINPSSWLAVSPITTNMRIALKHQPGIKNGQCDLGETDVEVEFPIVIK